MNKENQSTQSYFHATHWRGFSSHLVKFTNRRSRGRPLGAAPEYCLIPNLDVVACEGNPAAVLLLLDGDRELHLLLDGVELRGRVGPHQVVSHLLHLTYNTGM